MTMSMSLPTGRATGHWAVPVNEGRVESVCFALEQGRVFHRGAKTLGLTWLTGAS